VVQIFRVLMCNFVKKSREPRTINFTLEEEKCIHNFSESLSLCFNYKCSLPRNVGCVVIWMLNFSRRKEAVVYTRTEIVKSLLQLIHHESKCCAHIKIQGYFTLACGKCFVLYIKKKKKKHFTNSSRFRCSPLFSSHVLFDSKVTVASSDV
jgi:hypothetical protein